SVVLRILDRGSLALDFTELGFDDDLLGPFLGILNRPHGIVLVTGPTGSGKTTTLYTALTTLNSLETKILTIEDPIVPAGGRQPGSSQAADWPHFCRCFAELSAAGPR